MRSKVDDKSDRDQRLLGRGDRLPAVRVAPPGPAARKLVASLSALEAPAIHGSTSGDFLPSLAAAKGANVVDVDGNRYVDWVAGFGVAFSGHRPPEVVRALQQQADRLLLGLSDAAGHPLRARLAAQLTAIAPVDQPRIYWAISGSDAVDLALKAAYLHTGREKVVVFDPAYHGLGLGALGATSRPAFREPFKTLLAAHRFHRLAYGAPRSELDRAFARHRPGAVLFEPVVGREGIQKPAEGWLAEVAEVARRHGTLVVADEVLTGGGRTGRWFAVEHDAVRPDLLCCGKVLSGGAPLAAVIGREEVFAHFSQHPEAVHTSTFLAYPPACAAALANLKRIRRLDLLSRAVDLGEQLENWGQSQELPLDLSGRGAIQGLHLNSAAAASHFAVLARRRGFLVLSSNNVVQLTPPATLTAAQLRASLVTFSEILRFER